MSELDKNKLLLECEEQFKLLMSGQISPREVSLQAFNKSKQPDVMSLIESDSIVEEIFDMLLLAATPKSIDGGYLYGQEDFKKWWENYYASRRAPQ